MSSEHYDIILRNIARAGVYRTPQLDLADLLAAAEASGFSIRRVDLSAVRDKAALFERMAMVLEFPDWFGHNWDALADCLGDLSWMPAGGYLILLEDCDEFRASHTKDFTTALQVFAEACSAWREGNVPFWILVGVHTDGIAGLPALS